MMAPCVSAGIPDAGEQTVCLYTLYSNTCVASFSSQLPCGSVRAFLAASLGISAP